MRSLIVLPILVVLKVQHAGGKRGRGRRCGNWVLNPLHEMTDAELMAAIQQNSALIAAAVPETGADSQLEAAGTVQRSGRGSPFRTPRGDAPQPGSL